MAKKIHDRSKKSRPQPKAKEVLPREKKKPEIIRPDGDEEYISYRDSSEKDDFNEHG